MHWKTKISINELNKDFRQVQNELPIEHKKQKKGNVDILYCYNKNNYINFEMNLEYSNSLLINCNW